MRLEHSSKLSLLIGVGPQPVLESGSQLFPLLIGDVLADRGIVVGILAMTCAGLAHWFALRRLRRGEAEAPVLSQWPLSITVALLFSVIGLFGIWELLGH
jgi:hypothetical protein